MKRANFGSKLGVILASAGSAVGLGNIWRFPFETGNHGGAAFILIYLVCVLILGIPIMIAEFLIGRRSRTNTAGRIKAGSGNPLALGGTNGCISRIPYFGLLLGSSGLDLGIYRRSRNQQFCRQVRRRVHRFPSTALSAIRGVLLSGWWYSC